MALHEALALPEARLKWPNDVEVGGRKLAGILVEAAVTPQGPVVVVGVGVNVAAAPEGLGRPTVCLAGLGVATDAQAVAAAFLARLGGWAARYRAEGFGPVRTAWLERGPAMGAALAVQHGAESLVGGFAGLADDGALLLALEGRVIAVSAGEVTAGRTSAASRHAR